MSHQTKILLGTSVAVIAATSAWFFFLHRQYENDLSGFDQNRRIAEKRIAADGFLLKGDLQNAMALYKEIDSLTHDSLTQSIKKLPIYSLLSSYPDLLDDKAKILALTNRNPKLDQDNAASLPASAHDNNLNEELVILKEKLDSARNEINSLRENRGLIEFTSTKNVKVTYLGDLQEGKANGHGFGFWASGSKYEGLWKENMRHGKGVFMWADGVKYEGEFQDDQRHGFGVYSAKAGRYEGTWKNDMRHGEGMLYEPNGKLKVHGIWEKDKLVRTIK